MHFLEYLEHNNLVLAVLSSAKHKFIGVNTSIIVELKLVIRLETP